MMYKPDALTRRIAREPRGYHIDKDLLFSVRTARFICRIAKVRTEVLFVSTIFDNLTSCRRAHFFDHFEI